MTFAESHLFRAGARNLEGTQGLVLQARGNHHARGSIVLFHVRLM